VGNKDQMTPAMHIPVPRAAVELQEVRKGGGTVVTGVGEEAADFR
jgi:hypothetical protein